VYALDPVCSMLYQFAGKCNKHMSATEYNYDGYVYNPNYEYQNQAEDDTVKQNDGDDYTNNEWKQMFQSENQAQNENAVCNYIDALTSNTYNEFGEVSVTGTNWASPLAWNRAFASQSRAMSRGMKAAISITALAALGMSIAACVLHSMLARKNIPWKPRRSKGQDPTDLARQNSGITMGRSRSGPGTGIVTGSSNPLLNGSSNPLL
jgi:hypothetical protein